jgi:hypothetical protein
MTFPMVVLIPSSCSMLGCYSVAMVFQMISFDSDLIFSKALMEFFFMAH